MKSTVFAFLAAFIALATANYHHGGHHAMVQPGPAEILTYPGKVPLPPCGTVYLLTCNKNHQQVPCAVEHKPAPYHAAPAYHKPEPAPYHKPEPAPYHKPEPAPYHKPEPAPYHKPEPAPYHAPPPAKY